MKRAPLHQMKTALLRFGFLACATAAVCLRPSPGVAEDHLDFIAKVISNDANLWWARAFGDVDNDGLLDVVLHDNNGHGGWLGWLEASREDGVWKRHIIAETAPNGETFAYGDLDMGDIDGDGDSDVLAGVNANRAKNLGVRRWPVVIYLNQGDNSTWKLRKLRDGGIYNGQVADFDRDGDPDILRLDTHDGTQLEIWVNRARK